MARLLALSFVLVIGAGCGTSEPNAAATDSVVTPSARVTKVADSKATTGCSEYVADVRSACLDSITRGLDVKCGTLFMRVETARKQAAGSLFNVGDDAANRKTADAVCANFQETLAENRAERNAAMSPAAQSGPNCTALAENFETTCLDKLGVGELPASCDTAVRFLNLFNSAAGREKVCELASGALAG